MKFDIFMLRVIYFVFRFLSYIIGASLFLYGVVGVFGMSLAGSFSDFYVQLFALFLCISGGIYLVPFAKYANNKLWNTIIFWYQVVFNICLTLYLLFDSSKEESINYSFDLIHYIAIMSLVSLSFLILSKYIWGKTG